VKRIATFQIHNFKFFDDQGPIRLDGKHLLLYGENGSGKSSMYWALYTLFEAAIKSDDEEIKKYFRRGPTDDYSLVNIHASLVDAANGDYNSFVEVVTDGDAPAVYRISLTDQTIRGNSTAVEVNAASDFIDYKVLFRLQHFWHGEKIDLSPIFEHDVLPYVRFAQNSLLRNGAEKTVTNAYEMWEEFRLGPGRTRNRAGREIQAYKNSPEYRRFAGFTDRFNDSFKRLIEFINVNAPDLVREFGYDIDFQLTYYDAVFRKKDISYSVTPFKIEFKVTRYNGVNIEMFRPQSFLNEAKMTAISLAIRFTILRQRVNSEVGDILKFLVLDDLMISLDMNNRDRLVQYLLSDESGITRDYQILFFTHDRSLYYYLMDKIKNCGKNGDWIYREAFIDKERGYERPEIIEHPNKLKKAERFLLLNDYPACGIYLRLECEKLLNEILPDPQKYEVSLNGSGLYETKFANLNMQINQLEFFCQRERVDFLPYIDLSTYKSVILNTLAHNDIWSPLYREELEKVLDVLRRLRTIKRTLVVEKSGRDISFRLQKANGEDFMVGMRLRDGLRILQVGEEGARLSRFCQVEVNLVNDNGVLNRDRMDYRSIHDVLAWARQEFNFHEEIYLEDILVDREGRIFRHKIEEILGNIEGTLHASE